MYEAGRVIYILKFLYPAPACPRIRHNTLPNIENNILYTIG